MTHYLSFVVFALVVAVAPGPDTLLTLRSTASGGRGRGLWTMAGITLAGSVQGMLAASGLGAVIARAEPVFETVRWAGVFYLAFNLAVLPQFLGAGASWPTLLSYALTLSVVGGLVLLVVVLGADAAKRAIASRRARRGIDVAAGVAFLGFAAVLATEA